MKTLLIQSHRSPLPADWLSVCIESVKSWAADCRFEYRFIGDEIFDSLPADLHNLSHSQPVVASDIVRLHQLRSALHQGYDRAIWCDADVLIFAPQRLELPKASYAFGREVWVQEEGARLRSYRKIHNALMLFCQDNPFLDFYIHAAERLALAHQGPMVAQFLGPKFLSTIHNIIHCPVIEGAGMVSPAVIGDLLKGGGPALDLFLERSTQPPGAVNLCASLSANGEISDADIGRVIDLLLTRAPW